MQRITIHLSGVKPIITEKKVKSSNGTYEYVKKKIGLNTVTNTVKNEAEGMTYMSHYLNSHNGHKVTKYYFSNVI